MNKNTKILLKYALSILLLLLLIWGIWLQVEKQLGSLGNEQWWVTGNYYWLVIAIILMPINLGLEALKWKILVTSAQPLNYFNALKSLLAGISLSLITPNRIGEYPGRILYLKRKNTVRLVSVSILGAFAQFLSIFFFGILGLFYYNYKFPGPIPVLVLLGTISVTVLLIILFLRFEKWIQYFEKIPWLKRFLTYSQLMKRFTVREQLTVLVISSIRFAVFTVQYLILLQWMNVYISPAEGFLMASLFFWSISVIPSIALIELGVRGQVSLFLFHHFSQNTIGILAATTSLWCINLLLPAVLGIILLVRHKFWQ